MVTAQEMPARKTSLAYTADRGGEVHLALHDAVMRETLGAAKADSDQSDQNKKPVQSDAPCR